MPVTHVAIQGDKGPIDLLRDFVARGRRCPLRTWVCQQVKPGLCPGGRLVADMQWKENPKETCHECSVGASQAGHLGYLAYRGSAVPPVGNGLVYGVIVPLTAGLLVLCPRAGAGEVDRHLDRRDIRVVLLCSTSVLSRLCIWPSKGVYRGPDARTVSRFAAGLILGVVGPVIYTVWMRRRPCRSWPYQKELRQAVGSTHLLGAIQFFLTLYGYRLPAAVDWVPLLT